MSQGSKRISGEVARRSLFPFLVFFLALGLYIFYKVQLAYLLTPQVQENISRYTKVVFITSIAFILQRVSGAILSWYAENVASKTKTALDDELIPIFRRVAKLIIWVVALLIILPFFGVNINALIATLGVSSLAIALAAQDTISNIIAGFLIMIDKPFRIGDRIKLPSGEVVEVLDMGVRRSKFLAEDKAIIIVPNLDLSRSKIVNYTYGESRGKEGA